MISINKENIDDNITNVTDCLVSDIQHFHNKVRNVEKDEMVIKVSSIDDQRVFEPDIMTNICVNNDYRNVKVEILSLDDDNDLKVILCRYITTVVELNKEIVTNDANIATMMIENEKLRNYYNDLVLENNRLTKKIARYKVFFREVNKCSFQNKAIRSILNKY